MTEPTLACPNCKAEIRISESLAAPLVEATRKKFEGLIAEKESAVAAREASVQEQREALSQAKASLDAQLAERLAAGRQKIAAEEAKKAKLLAASDLDQKSKEVADLHAVLQERETKLALAQAAQAELLKTQRALADAQREMPLTIERKVQDSLSAVREKAKKEAEDGLKLKVQEKDERIAAMQEKLAQGEDAMRTQQANLEETKARMARELAERLAVEREKITAEEGNKAKLLAASDMNQKLRELADLNEVLKERDTKLAAAQTAQVELIKKQRDLDDAMREVALTVETKVQESLASVRDKAKQEAEDSLQLKVVEKELVIASMQRQIEDLKRVAEQGSQQLQGEAAELQFETLLRAKFPRDEIEPVGKGELGADVKQIVFNPHGQPCGIILWELKRTKNWSDAWPGKLRDDQRAVKADLAVIVSQAMPKGVSTFDLIDEVWVSEPRCAIPVAMCLRQSLIETASARAASEGQQTKMELVYRYLTGPGFKQRVAAIVDKFSDMHDDLNKERKSMMKAWAKREAQINGVLDATAGMYGDLQGIAGKALVDIEVLKMPLLEANSDATATQLGTSQPEGTGASLRP